MWKMREFNSLKFRHIIFFMFIKIVLSQVAISQDFEKNTTLIETVTRVSKINQEVLVFYNQGKYVEAEKLAQTALDIIENNLKNDPRYLSTSYNNLASIYRKIGDLNKSLNFYKKALNLNKELFGNSHPNIAINLSNLASLYQAMGDYKKALETQLQALDVFEKTLGSEHPDTATQLLNLASIYQSVGKTALAFPLLQRALSINEKSLGPEHPNTASTLNNLGSLYEFHGEYEKALPVYQQALKVTEKIYGSDNQNTGIILNNVANIYKLIGDNVRAAPLFQRSLMIAENSFGPEHITTANRLNNLALLYRNMGAYDKALPLSLRSLAISEKNFGSEHPSMAINLGNLAGLYRALGAYDKALPLYERALAISEKSNGPRHVETATAINNLAGLYRGMGKYIKARDLYIQELSITENLLGHLHPSVGISLNNLALLYRDMGDFERALPLLQRALYIQEKSTGRNNSKIVNNLNNLASLYKTMGAIEKALPLYQRSLLIAFTESNDNSDLLIDTGNKFCELKKEINIMEAIFYCKIAVEAIDNYSTKDLSNELQDKFIQKLKFHYDILISLLTQEMRNSEAEEITLLWKNRSSRNFTKNPEERKLYVKYNELESYFLSEMKSISGRIKKKQEELHVMKDGDGSGNQNSFDKLDREIQISEKNFIDTTNQVSQRIYNSDKLLNFASNPDNSKFIKYVKNLNSATPDAENAFVTIFCDEINAFVSVYTSKGLYSISIPIKPKDLYSLVGSMRTAILNKNDDWRISSLQLYNLLILPIEKTFQKNNSNISTITFFTPYELLKIPFSSLLDGNNKFLIEKYAIANYSISDGGIIGNNWQENWTISAFGSSLSSTSEKIPQRPGIAEEIKNIVQDNGFGIIPGKKYIDYKFNRFNFNNSLYHSDKKKNVLHIASSFEFNQYKNDYHMILGDGSLFSMKDFDRVSVDLSQFDLVTLSGCAPNLDKDNKITTELISSIFLKKGASAVLSNLWLTEDQSTAQFMPEFYKARGEIRAMSKAHALQQAQLKFISHPKWSHPYYWAGFVLYGNWL